MAQKRRSINGEYAQKLNAIRSFVNFNYDLRHKLHPNSKRKIDRYYNAISAIQARPNRVYRTKNKKRLRTVQEFGRNGFEDLPQIKVAFYESSAANPVHLSFGKKNQLHAHGKYFDIRYVPFNRLALLRDAETEVKRALQDHGTKNAKWFRIAVGADGQYSIASPRIRARVFPFVKHLMLKYSEFDDEGKRKNNYWGNWLHGLLPMTPKNQTELREFLLKESRIKEQLKQKRKRRARNAKNFRLR